MISEKMFLEARIFRLTSRIANQASTTLLDKEYDILKAQLLTRAATEYIAALEARKTQLAA